MPATHLATFQVNATVPLGHGLCGGWIKPALCIDSPLMCRGLILLGSEAPIVLAAIDWTGVCNDAHTELTVALARAAHTTPERVALHAVHQHNAPFLDVTAQKLVSQHPDLPASCDLPWFAHVKNEVIKAIETALQHTQPVTHVAFGQAKVEKIASNRRILGPDGKISAWRASACKDAQLRAAPEGLIDPYLKSISLYDADTRLITLHWYATHPMSYYGDGIVNHDFVGMARERRVKETKAPHLYFTGCAGNVAAGKYNDGAPQRRGELADRLHQAMTSADEKAPRAPLKKWRWQSMPVHLPPRSNADETNLKQQIADGKQSPAQRIRAAMQLSYRSFFQNTPIQLQSLHLNDELVQLHLPAECFVEFQLFAQKSAADCFVAFAAYGNGGPWYIPTADAYAQGGYEPSAAFVDPDAEKILKDGITKLLQG